MLLTGSRGSRPAKLRYALGPQGNLLGEKYSPTQPFPMKPPPFGRTSVTMDDIAQDLLALARRQPVGRRRLALLAAALGDRLAVCGGPLDCGVGVIGQSLQHGGRRA